MILYGEEGDQVCLACYLSALTVYTLPAIHTRVVSSWGEQTNHTFWSVPTDLQSSVQHGE